MAARRKRMAATRKTTVGVGDLLPSEIWTDILTRLSAKMVLRCRSVCKSWYSLTSCTNFISDHSTRNLNKNENRVLLHIKDGNGWSYRSLDESGTESRVHDDIPNCSSLEIVGSCNGLICLPNTQDGMIFSSENRPRISFIIWNPTIRKIVKVPSRPFHPRTQRLSYFGFGFDSKANDYKVLCVVGNRDRNSGDNYISDAMCEIFDLKTGVWRVICPRAPSSWCLGSGNIPECYLDGAVHWSDRDRWVLLSFSFDDECFREIKMTNLQYRGMSIRCVTFGGLIHVILWAGLDNEHCLVWAMEEYGVGEYFWTRVFGVNLKCFGAFHTHFNCQRTHLFRLWRNGEGLLVHVYSVRDRGRDIRGKEELVSYNPESREFESLLSFRTISDVCFYEESLVLM